MSKVIAVDGLSVENLAKAVAEVRKYRAWVEQKEVELRSELAKYGKESARIQFDNAVYDGVKDVTVRVDDTGSVAVIYAEGKSVVFIEFGSGEKYGGGHPLAATHGFEPGSWSLDPSVGKGHWDDPNGWYYAHGKKSYGNPPAMAMWGSVQDMTENLTQIAKEVFRGA